MKVLIVDDEADVRDSIRLLVDWDTYQISDILEASDGAAAMALIQRERPEIIFTDMKMPNVDGIALLQWIETALPTAKTIAISGYDDYAYIRKTMKHGGLDYLLKPINPGELHDALHNAVKAWRQEEEGRRIDHQKDTEMQQTKKIFWDKALSDAVARPGLYRTVAEELAVDFSWTDKRECRIAVALSDPLPRIVHQKFGRHLDLLYFSMTNICNEIIGRRQDGYAFKHLDPNYGVVILWLGDPDALDSKLHDMNAAFARILGARFPIVCGTCETFPERLPDAFDQALQIARTVSFRHGGAGIHRRRAAGPANEKRIVLGDYSDRISVAVYSGDPRQIEAAVAAWLQAIEQLESVTLDHLHYWRYEYALLRDRLLQRQTDSAGVRDEPSDPALFPIDADGALSIAQWQREWTEEFLRIADLLKRDRQPEQHAVYHVKQLLETRYRHNLSLQDIADRFFMSREHVSRRFKQEFGVNISEYLERVRIENAKVLLVNDKESIASVAAMVGYPDSRYFSKIFRKLTGMTPREYRKTTGADRSST